MPPKIKISKNESTEECSARVNSFAEREQALIEREKLLKAQEDKLMQLREHVRQETKILQQLRSEASKTEEVEKQDIPASVATEKNEAEIKSEDSTIISSAAAAVEIENESIATDRDIVGASENVTIRGRETARFEEANVSVGMEDWCIIPSLPVSTHLLGAVANPWLASLEGSMSS